MPLTTADLENMIIEIDTGKTPSLQTAEADAMREVLRKQIAAIHAKGGIVEIPPPD